MRAALNILFEAVFLPIKPKANKIQRVLLGFPRPVSMKAADSVRNNAL